MIFFGDLVTISSGGGDSAPERSYHANERSILETVDLEEADTVKWLEELRVEHRDLDEVIQYLIESRHHDLMKIQRLKKRKLRLKDMISRLESELIPDLDA